MRVHYIQHVPFEGLGFIETWLNEYRHIITVTRVWEKAIFPAMDAFDVLIIMGGPMSVNDDELYGWLTEEKSFISSAINNKKKIIGICLGAQLLATVLGAVVYPNKYKEIGWFPVNFRDDLGNWLGMDLPSSLNVFHWHGDKFDIPAGGVLQASSDACDHQVFTVGEDIIGLQFHLEADKHSMQSMLKFGADELVKDKFVQEAGEIAELAAFKQPNELMGKILMKICGSAVSTT
ncbi:MAG: amidotransferase [Citrobacter freundii]|nr:MAG: amidotransferase [Citrobacter freundii]